MRALAKQLRSRRKGIGVERERERESGMGWQRLGKQGQCQERTPNPRFWHQNVRKNAVHKESS
jgi:hypothetical protein